MRRNSKSKSKSNSDKRKRRESKEEAESGIARGKEMAAGGRWWISITKA
jgi:hypothetical protein